MVNKEKKYYWIKLKNAFMTSDTVDFLMGQKNGSNYVVLYQMLCLKTINTKGELSRTLGEFIVPFDIDKIQRDCKWFDRDTIIVAMELYKKLGLVYEQENGVLIISNYHNLIGGESESADRVRRFRGKKEEEKALQCNGECNENVALPLTLSLISNSLDVLKEKEEIVREEETAKNEEEKNQWFESFWSMYPKHENKKKSRIAFFKFCKDVETYYAIFESLEKFKKSKQWKDKQFVPLASTWLNGERWNDEVMESGKGDVLPEYYKKTERVKSDGKQVFNKRDFKAIEK